MDGLRFKEKFNPQNTAILNKLKVELILQLLLINLLISYCVQICSEGGDIGLFITEVPKVL